MINIAYINKSSLESSIISKKYRGGPNQKADCGNKVVMPPAGKAKITTSESQQLPNCIGPNTVLLKECASVRLKSRGGTLEGDGT